ncbi:hypothetical protein QQF64_004007 [Cirrhinus molitorella]|uniref:Secreted protein n=1 Tax=Cirrhinus molitorella TaxID=172907 RepID=A0ABR3MMX4_9TELE
MALSCCGSVCCGRLYSAAVTLNSSWRRREKGGGGGPTESPGLTSPGYFSTEQLELSQARVRSKEKVANGGSGALMCCLTVNNA